MGLFKKIKDVLFDEEEYTEQIKITPEMRNEETPAKEEKVQAVKVEEEVVKPKEKEERIVKSPSEVSERELFKTDSNFPFFDFDEEEFINQNPPKAPEREEVKPAPIQRPSNVFEFERKRKVEKRTDFGRYEKTEVTESTEKRKFKPSPIISPVYGILDKDYVKTDIVQRKDVDKMDVQTVRNKAFAPSPVKEEVHERYPETSFYEESETVTITEPEEKEKKVKTIDELLEDTSDVIVDIDHDLDTIEQKLRPSSTEKEEVKEKNNIEDTLENDLFDLIDSMYDSKEEGEE